MNKISFYNINKKTTRIDFTVVTEMDSVPRNEENIYFEFNCENNVSNSALACSFIALIMNAYKKVYIDLPLPQNCLSFLRNGLKSEITCKEEIADSINNRNNTNLNNIALLFSGGFDSLAAMNLFNPGRLKLISLDYGGVFADEKLCFSQFKTYNVATNCRASNFFKYASKFYVPAFSIGAILYAEKLAIGYAASGDILEAFHDFNCTYPNYVYPGSYLNIRQVRPTFGLTEVGTAMIVKKMLHPSLINTAINSLAKPGSTKRLRKDVLLNFVGGECPINTIKTPLKFGRDYVMDFLFLHIFKYNKSLGEKMVTSVPKDVIEFLTCHKLDFYKKINPKSLRNIPDDINMNFFLDTLYKCGIDIYNSEDFKELHETRSLLAKYYNEENKNIKIGVL
ncbi:hypothetical protein [Succiniclasticum ruminis]|uniref:Uncharacterized protein n=1 Tax=Succiniclasticum ruminis DSM 9236 TaxID=1123323 RepID=A0A1I2ABD3_9FIRM|nr:hypothetical protein [Succiniclasticum ruminis]SFE41057.1 hypothetical protein SAMN05216245_105116 [Succiniclasticum ruminis DSM 9236]